MPSLVHNFCLCFRRRPVPNAIPKLPNMSVNVQSACTAKALQQAAGVWISREQQQEHRRRA